MQKKSLCRRAVTFLIGVTVLLFSHWASADPPSRVARLGYMRGAVSFSPAGASDWVPATVNRPLTSGDRLWAVAGARAEIQVSANMIRMNADTGLSVLNLDDQTVQLQLTQGTLTIRVRRLEPSQVFEVDTPNLALMLRQPGQYLISVDPAGHATDIVVRQGQAEAYGEGVSYVIDARQPYRFYGTGLREYQLINAPSPDEFDRWASERDRQYDNSISARYVSADVMGYQDLDDNGIWRVDATYGYVWIPHHVAAGWAPYRNGQWVWVAPWGWTWVDDARWGFAVSHYGRWMYRWDTWCWVPGPARARAYYAPALVAFVGGNHVQLPGAGGHVNGIAWFPLAPREVFRPAYPVSRRYFEHINRSNTVITDQVMNNTDSTRNGRHAAYANRHIPGAVIAVPTTAFVQSQPVARSTVPVTLAASTPVAFAAPVAPNAQSVRGVAGRSDPPPARVFDRPVVARPAPPVAPTGLMPQPPQRDATSGEARGRPWEAKPTVVPPAVRILSRPQEGVSSQVVPAPAPKITAPQVLAPSVPDSRGGPEQRFKREEPRRPLTAPPVVAAPAPWHRPEPPRLVVPPAPQVAPFVPTQRAAPPLPQAVSPEAAPAARHVEPMPPVAAPKPPPQRVRETPFAPAVVLPALPVPETASKHSPPAATPFMPKSEPPAQGVPPKPRHQFERNDDDERKRDGEARKRKE